MPPKLFLNINTSTIKSYRPGGGEDPLEAPSIEIGPMGTLKLYQSLGTAYEFNKKGMTSNMTSPLGNGAVAMQQSYQLSEKDVQFIRTLGQGASGLVQKAFWPAKSEFIAVKKISVLEREKRHQLMNDIKALCKIPNIPGLIRFFGAYHSADRGQIAVALEYMDGGSLADVLVKVQKVPEEVLAAITVRVLQGLSYMHANHMVHRDIKPANILMSTAGEPKVSDFGISAFVDNTIAQCHTFLGTVTYMSPERINGQPYSFPADIWALGLTLLECATGRYPYDASGGAIDLMVQLMEDECPLPPDGQLSPELCDFVQQCMARDPLKRPAAAELLRHPFVAKGRGVDLKGFMQCMYDPVGRLEDVVTILASRHYNNLAYNWRESDSIASYYASDATMKMGEEHSKGRYTVAQQLHELMKYLSAYGEAMFVVDELEHCPVSEEKGIVSVTTKVSIKTEPNPMTDDEPAIIGIFKDSFTVRILSLDTAQPDINFLFLSQELQWIKPLAPLPVKQQRQLAAHTKCRQQ